MNLPPYRNFPNISSNRILLKQIPLTDFEEIIEISFYDGRQATNIEQTIEIFEKINNDYNKGDSIHWGIYDLTINKIVGTCGYYRGFKNGVGELGCILLQKYRGQGYMSSAMKLIIKFGIEVIALKQIIAITTVQNKKAINLLSHLDFVIIENLGNSKLKYKFRDKIIS